MPLHGLELLPEAIPLLLCPLRPLAGAQVLGKGDAMVNLTIISGRRGYCRLSPGKPSVIVAGLSLRCRGFCRRRLCCRRLVRHCLAE